MPDFSSTTVPPDITAWLAEQFQQAPIAVAPITGDASSRSYYRVHCQTQGHAQDTSFIVLSEQKGKSASIQSFLDVRQMLFDIGLSVPVVYRQDEAQGLLLLSDLGDRQYGHVLTNEHRAYSFYRRAFYPLIWMQREITPANCPIPLKNFDAEFMFKQLHFFKEWYIERHLHHQLTAERAAELDTLFKAIITVVAEQPLVFSHMDYHSRNLMVLYKQEMPGILDFQDAMWAPCTLDLLSLLKDCYLDWPREQVVHWVHDFYQLRQALWAEASNVDFHTFLRWFDWTGVQRHLRILGTFSRLQHAYDKPSYLQYVPRILMYLIDMAETYPELKSLENYLR